MAHTILSILCFILLCLFTIGLVTAAFCMWEYDRDIKKAANTYTKERLIELINHYKGIADSTKDVEKIDYALDYIDYYKSILEEKKKRKKHGKN